MGLVTHGHASGRDHDHPEGRMRTTYTFPARVGRRTSPGRIGGPGGCQTNANRRIERMIDKRTTGKPKRGTAGEQ